MIKNTGAPLMSPNSPRKTNGMQARKIPHLLRELKREAERGNKPRTKECRHIGDLPLIALRTIEDNDLKRKCSIEPCCFVSSIHGKSWLSIGAGRK